MTGMKDPQDPLPCVELNVARDDVATAEELLAALDMMTSSWTNVETGTACIWVFCASEAEALCRCDRIAKAMPDWLELLSAAPAAPTIRHWRQEDWANSWKQFFPAFRASRRLIVKPSWEHVQATPGDILLEIDPGMCFGTGYHGTTRACLEFLDDLAAQLGSVSLLDAGCGSGILSLAAVRLGLHPVVAFDHDPQAVRTARENLATAGIHTVDIMTADLAEFTPRQSFRIIVANIVAGVLQAQCRHLRDWLDTTHGPAYLVLAGILREQYPGLRDAVLALGCRETASRTIAEWTSGCFEYTPAPTAERP